MRIGYLQGGLRTEIQSALGTFASDLIASGHRVAGMVERPAVLKRDSLLADVASGAVTCIFQYLGENAQSCALDPGALTHASGLVEAAVTPETEILILSKFGKMESEGGGFRGVIAKALMLGIPVLTSVNPAFQDSWLAFTDGLATQLPADLEQLQMWWKREAQFR